MIFLELPNLRTGDFELYRSCWFRDDDLNDVHLNLFPEAQFVTDAPDPLDAFKMIVSGQWMPFRHFIEDLIEAFVASADLIQIFDFLVVEKRFLGQSSRDAV